MAQRVKRLPAMRRTWVRSLGGEDPPEKEMATHSSILAWKTPWMEKPGGLQSEVALTKAASGRSPNNYFLLYYGFGESDEFRGLISRSNRFVPRV